MLEVKQSPWTMVIRLLILCVAVLSSTATLAELAGKDADNCSNQSCYGRGRCYNLDQDQDYICVCESGFYGKDCALDLNQVKENIAWVHIDLGGLSTKFDQGLHTLKEDCTKLGEEIKKADEYLKNLEPINGPGTEEFLRSAKLDLQLIVDGSGNVTEDGFRLMLQQITDSLIDGLDIGVNRTRVAFSRFSSRGDLRNELLLTSSYDKDYIKSKIKGIGYTGGAAYTADAMTKILPMFKEHQRNGENVTRVCIVYTNGKADDKPHLEAASKAWADNEVSVFAVGIGSGIDQDTMNKIAGDESRILKVDDFDQISRDDCKGANCSGNGACEDWFNGYTCDCNTGYSGKNCETNIDDCEGMNCNGNGVCQDGINDYTCTCNAGFVGKDCETDEKEEETHFMIFNGWGRR